jgi:hypothetical protein
MNYAFLTVPDFALHALCRTGGGPPRPPGGARGRGGAASAKVTEASAEAAGHRARARRDPRHVPLPRDHPPDRASRRRRPRPSGSSSPRASRSRRAWSPRPPAPARSTCGAPTGRAPRRSCGGTRRSSRCAGLPLRVGAGRDAAPRLLSPRGARPRSSSSTMHAAVPGAAAARLRGADRRPGGDPARDGGSRPWAP